MGFFSNLWNGICSFVKRVWNSIKKLFVAIFSFFKEAVTWFRNKFLNPNKDKPFIGDFNQIIKEGLKDAPTKNVGIFRGVYDEQADEITDIEIISANSMDAQTKNILGNEKLVILS